MWLIINQNIHQDNGQDIDSTTLDEFIDKFIELVESFGWITWVTGETFGLKTDEEMDEKYDEYFENLNNANRPRMTAKEFRKLGYLQEVNRQFLHPLGLAIETVIESDGSERFGQVWDYRSDPEGIIFGDIDETMIEKMLSLTDIWTKRRRDRMKTLGFIIQPLSMPDKK